MCLLIHQPRGVTFSRSEIADFATHNPDGFGVAYGDGRRLHLLRLVGSLSEIQDAYTRHAAGRECVIHFRMTTHGATNADNAHPYPITPDIAVAHNGMLAIGNPHDQTMSDTWHLVEFFLRPIAETDPDLLFNPVWGDMLGRLIGSGNKLAIAHRDGRVAIINKAAGTTHKGAWLSNTYAWSAPRPEIRTPGRATSPSYSSPYAMSFRDDLVPDLWDTAPVRRTTATTYTPLTPDTPPVPMPNLRATAHLVRTWEDVEVAYRQDREQGVLIWTQNNPENAATLLVDVYGVTMSEAREWLEDYPSDAAILLAETIAEEVGVS